MKSCVCEDEKAIFRQQVKKRDRYCMSQPNNTKDVKVEIGDLSLSLSQTRFCIVPETKDVKLSEFCQSFQQKLR